MIYFYFEERLSQQFHSLETIKNFGATLFSWLTLWVVLVVINSKLLSKVSRQAEMSSYKSMGYVTGLSTLSMTGDAQGPLSNSYGRQVRHG